MPELISAMHDVVFKALFIRNPDILRAFLRDILDLPLTETDEVVIQNPEIVPKSLDEKVSRLDIYVKMANQKFNVEMQISPNGFHTKRLRYYSYIIYIDDLKSGKNYDDLQKTYSVNILGFKLFDFPKYHSSFSAREDELYNLLDDSISVHIFELPKVPKEFIRGDRKQLWMKLLQAESKEELDMLKAQSDNLDVEKAIEILNEINADPVLREQIRQREKAINDYNNDMSVAEKKGRAEGKAEGILEERNRLIEKMRKNGIPEEQIQSMLA